MSRFVEIQQDERGSVYFFYENGINNETFQKGYISWVHIVCVFFWKKDISAPMGFMWYKYIKIGTL